MRRWSAAGKLYATCVAVVLYLCLFPWTVREGPFGPWFTLGWAGGRTGVADLILNFSLYIPLGILGWLTFERFHPKRTALLLSGVLSLLVEFAQGWLPGRVSSLTDFLSNGAGAVFGVVVAPWAITAIRRQASGLGALRVSVPATLFFLAFVAGQAFPFFPSYRLPRLRAAFESAMEAGDPLRSFYVLLIFAAAGFWLRYVISPPLRSGWRFLLLLVVLLSHPFFSPSPLTGGEWVAGVAGSACGALLQTAILGRSLAVLLPLLLVLDEFRPFCFVTQPADFGWIPFRALFDITPSDAIRFFAAKCFLFGSVIFTATQRGVPRFAAAIGVAAILGAGEAAQRYLPGRTPESTDLFLALAAWLLLSLPEAGRATRPPAAAPTGS